MITNADGFLRKIIEVAFDYKIESSYYRSTSRDE